MIRLPEIKTAELSTYGNFAMCHQALFRVPREGLGTRLDIWMHAGQVYSCCPKLTIKYLGLTVSVIGKSVLCWRSRYGSYVHDPVTLKSVTTGTYGVIADYPLTD